MSNTIITNIAIEVFGSVLCSVFVVCILITDGLGTRLGRSFIAVLVSNIAVMLSDVLGWMCNGQPGTFNYWGTYLGNLGTFIFSYILIMAFSDYLNRYIATIAPIKRTSVYAVWAVCGLAIFLTVVALFNDMYFIVDEHNIYHRQWFYWFSQVFGIVSMLINAVVIIQHRRHYNRMECFALASYVVFPLIAIVIQMLVYGFASVYISSTLVIMIIYVGLQAQQSKVLKEKELELAESRIAIMLSQIQPHFLYNALTVVKHLCDIDPAAAKQSLDEFSTYLRGNLESLSQTGLISLADELHHAESYLALEKRRYGDRLNIVYAIEADDFKLPPLTLQPIVENAVRHGIARLEEGGTITVHTFREPGYSVVRITDNGPGFNPDAPSPNSRRRIGLDNVRSRLAAMCAGTLDILSSGTTGTAITVRIPD